MRNGAPATPAGKPGMAHTVGEFVSLLSICIACGVLLLAAIFVAAFLLHFAVDVALAGWELWRSIGP